MNKTSEYINKKTEEIRKSAEILETAISCNNFALVNEEYGNLATKCVDLANKVKNDAFSRAFNSQEIKGRLSYMYEASAEKEGEVTHIHINSLLPTRKSQVFLNDKSLIELTYVAALNRAVEEKRITPYRKKVVLAIVHNFSPTSRLIDHDNFYIKPIIDGITSVLLIDDSPDRVTLYMDARIESEESTDIYVVPYEIFDISIIKGNERKVVAL